MITARLTRSRYRISGRASGHRFCASFGEVRLPAAFEAGNARLVVRREAIEIDTEGVNGFEGTAEEAGYLGTHARAAVRLGRDLLRVSMPPHMVFEAGRPARSRLPPGRLWVVDDAGAG